MKGREKSDEATREGGWVVQTSPKSDCEDANSFSFFDDRCITVQKEVVCCAPADLPNDVAGSQT